MALLQEHRANAYKSTKGRHLTAHEVCQDLQSAGICSGWGGGNPTTGEGGEGCSAPDDEGEIAYALQRRKDIRSGKVQGESVEWLGYESLHTEPENCKGGEYYGGPGFTNNCWCTGTAIPPTVDGDRWKCITSSGVYTLDNL